MRGPPVLRNLPLFDETTSHIADTLHVVCHGLVKDILTVMVERFGKTFTFRGRGEKDKNFPYQDKLQRQLKIPSEINHPPPSFSEYPKKWMALDCLTFLLHEITMLCSDTEVIVDEKIYPIFVHLSNAVYLMHYGRFTPEIREQAEIEVFKFCRLFRDCFTEEYCTYKFHVFQHFIDMLKEHGPAFLWDAFIGKEKKK
jgi:hypothetical protein